MPADWPLPALSACVPCSCPCLTSGHHALMHLRLFLACVASLQMRSLSNIYSLCHAQKTALSKGHMHMHGSCSAMILGRAGQDPTRPSTKLDDVELGGEGALHVSLLCKADDGTWGACRTLHKIQAQVRCCCIAQCLLAAPSLFSMLLSSDNCLLHDVSLQCLVADMSMATGAGPMHTMYKPHVMPVAVHRKRHLDGGEGSSVGF